MLALTVSALCAVASADVGGRKVLQAAAAAAASAREPPSQLLDVFLILNLSPFSEIWEMPFSLSCTNFRDSNESSS